jgi:hypothetical protein
MVVTNELAKLGIWINQQIKSYPQHKDEIIDFYQLCLDEIEGGASIDNEIYLCKDSIEDLINGES